jgi:hypothetical protein
MRRRRPGLTAAATTAVLATGAAPGALAEMASDRIRALERADPHRRCVIDSIWSKEAHARVKIASVESVSTRTHKFHQLGGRGLISHQARKYPECPWLPLCEAERASAPDSSERSPGTNTGSPRRLAKDASFTLAKQ